MVDKLKEYEAGIAKEQREAFTPKWVGADETKCPLCGERPPIYCEKCFKDEVEAQLKIHGYSRIEDIMNNPYNNPYIPKFPEVKVPDIKVPKIEIPHIEISTFPKWPGTCKPEDIRWGMDLAEGPDNTVEELTQWKKEDKPEPDLEELLEIKPDAVEAVKEYAKSVLQRSDEINEGRGV